MLKIGLTGGIASGKSTVSDWLKARHYPVIDADLIAREVVAPGEPILTEIANQFGGTMVLPNGELNRKALGKLIFKDDGKREQLNNLLHPLIRQRMKEKMDRLERLGAPVVFLDIPLLFESPIHDWADKTIVVYVSKANQLKRLMKRNQLTENEALRRIEAQMPLEEKKRLADAVIDNNGARTKLEKQLVDLLKRWTID